MKTDLTYIIRDLVLDDYYRGLLETLSVFGPTDLDFEAFQSLYYERGSNGIHTAVAVTDEGRTICGTASIQFEPKFIHDGGIVGKVEDVAVQIKYQGQGIGGALVLELLEKAEEAGCYKVILNCDKDVRPFYKKLGFVEHGVQMRYDLA